LVTLVAACDDDKGPSRAGAGGSGGAAAKDSGADMGTPSAGGSGGSTGGAAGTGGNAVDGGSDVTAPPTGDGGLAPCLDQPGLDRPPSGQLPCELLPPGFVAP
jgi:hypothetical protein